jgi:hypothetical protein
VLYYRTLVIRRSPVGPRPPSPYKLSWSGRYYEVWQRPPAASGPQVVDHLSLGTAFAPAAKPKCTDVLNLAKRAQGGELVAVRRDSPILVSLGPIPRATAPPLRAKVTGDWVPNSGDQTILVPHKPGAVEFSLTARSANRFDFWLAGSFQPRVELLLDGKLIGAGRQELNYQGEFHHFGQAVIGTGEHRLRLVYGGTDLHPGSAARGFPLGPLVLTRAKNKGTLVSVPPAKARSLCGQSLDWVEAVR